MKQKTLVEPKIEIKEIAAMPKEGQSMEELIEAVKAAGNTIKRIDVERNRVLLMEKENN